MNPTNNKQGTQKGFVPRRTPQGPGSFQHVQSAKWFATYSSLLIQSETKKEKIKEYFTLNALLSKNIWGIIFRDNAHYKENKEFELKQMTPDLVLPLFGFESSRKLLDSLRH